MEIEIDFSAITNSKVMHQILNEKFGFISGYGNNIHALIDSWSSLRSPEHGMTKIVLDKEDVITLKITSICANKFNLLSSLLFAVQAVNKRYKSNNRKIPLYVVLIEEKQDTMLDYLLAI